MKTVHLLHLSANDTLEIINQLRQQGYQQNTDFDFAYHQATYDNDGWSAVTPKHAEFIFYNEMLATWFSLKYKWVCLGL